MSTNRVSCGGSVVDGGSAVVGVPGAWVVDGTIGCVVVGDELVVMLPASPTSTPAPHAASTRANALMMMVRRFMGTSSSDVSCLTLRMRARLLGWITVS